MPELLTARPPKFMQRMLVDAIRALGVENGSLPVSSHAAERSRRDG
jgi:hypothetical protein